MRLMILFLMVVVLCVGCKSDDPPVRFPEMESLSGLQAMRMCSEEFSIPVEERDVEMFEHIEVGMSYAEIVALVGCADGDIGSGVHLLTYTLPDDRVLVLQFVSLDRLNALFFNSSGVFDD